MQQQWHYLMRILQHPVPSEANRETCLTGYADSIEHIGAAVQKMLQETLAGGCPFRLELTLHAQTSPTLFAHWWHPLQPPETFSGKEKLSTRELQVLQMIMQGHTNQEIAGKLFISIETVKSHRKHLLSKTGARNTAALINHFHHHPQ